MHCRKLRHQRDSPSLGLPITPLWYYTGGLREVTSRFNASLYACVRFVASSRPVMRYAKEASDITRCSAIGLLPQRASLVTAGSEAWGTT